MDLPPVRCFTCNKVIIQSIYDDYHAFKELQDQSIEHATKLVQSLSLDDLNLPDSNLSKLWTELGIKRDCCKQIIMGYQSNNRTAEYCNYDPGKYVKMQRTSQVKRRILCR